MEYVASSDFIQECFCLKSVVEASGVRYYPLFEQPQYNTAEQPGTNH